MTIQQFLYKLAVQFSAQFMDMFKEYPLPKTVDFSKIIFALIMAFILVSLVFPDVVFMGATFSMTGLYNGWLHKIDVMQIFPEPMHRGWHHGLYDAGGAVFQADPMIQFIKYAWHYLESPYWNPFQATGSLGPETLVDQKFSFLTNLSAIFGASVFSYDMIVLGLYTLATGFLFLLINQVFKLSRLAAIAACVFYLLNGFNIANLNSNIIQVYLYFPMALYALCIFSNAPSFYRWLFLVFANLLIVSCTFLPTSVLVLFSIYFIAFGFSTMRYANQVGRLLKIFLLQSSAFLIAFLLFAFVYFPVFESFFFLDTIAVYDKRIFAPVKLAGALSFFSPKHFWESYNAIDLQIHDWYKTNAPTDINNPSLIGNVAFHFGIVASILVAASLRKWDPLKKYLLLTLVILLSVSLMRIFGVPGLSHLIDHTIGFRYIRGEYWWIAVAIPFALLVAFGVDALRTQKAKWLPLMLLYLTIIGLLCYVFCIYGLIEPNRGSRIVSLGLIGVTLALSCVLIYKIQHSATQNGASILSILLIVLMFVEFSYYVNHYRYKRNDIFQTPSKEILLLKSQVGLHRVLNVGLYGLTPEYGSAYQIQQIESLNSGIFPDYLKFFQKNLLPDDKEQRWGEFASFHNVKDEPVFDPHILNFLAVKYIVLPITFHQHKAFLLNHGYRQILNTDATFLFENDHVFARAFAVPTLIENNLVPKEKTSALRDLAFTDDKTLLAIAKRMNINLKELVKEEVLEKQIKNQAVQIKEYHNAKIVLEANLETPAVVILADNWHPNWKAYVDGELAYIGKVNESFRGVIVDKGLHKIEMRYRPKTLSMGIGIALTSLAFIFILFLFRKKIDHRLKKTVYVEKSTI